MWEIARVEAGRPEGGIDIDDSTLPQEANFEELQGISVFYQDASGDVYHTYSSYARGADPVVGAYQWLDLVPKGRDEGDPPEFWIRRHDEYETARAAG